MKRRIVLSVVFIMLALPCLANAEEGTASERPWSDSAELSLVQIGGNAESFTIGFKNLYQYKWSNALFALKAGGIRSESTVFTRFAVGSLGNFVTREEEKTEKTAENYYINGKYNRNISEIFFWFAGGGWDRNEFAGIKNRYSAFGGVGNIWLDSERRKFKTDYGIQYTKETPVFKVEDFDENYAAVRFSYNYFQKIFRTSTFTQDFEWISNLDETSDYRASLLNALSTAINSYISLKVGLDLFYDNQPAYEAIPLFDDMMAPTGITVPFELDELDYVFTTAMVITF